MPLQDAVRELVNVAGEEGAELLIRGLTKMIGTDGKWETPTLPPKVIEAAQQLAKKPFASVKGGRPSIIDVYVELYALSPHPDKVMAQAKESMKPATYARFRKRIREREEARPSE